MFIYNIFKQIPTTNKVGNTLLNSPVIFANAKYVIKIEIPNAEMFLSFDLCLWKKYKI